MHRFLIANSSQRQGPRKSNPDSEFPALFCSGSSINQCQIWNGLQTEVCRMVVYVPALCSKEALSHSEYGRFDTRRVKADFRASESHMLQKCRSGASSTWFSLHCIDLSDHLRPFFTACSGSHMLTQHIDRLAMS